VCMRARKCVCVSVCECVWLTDECLRVRICMHIYVRLGFRVYTYAHICPSEMDKSARARRCAHGRVCAATCASACAYVRICATHTLAYAGWSCESAFIASRVAGVSRRKCQAVATNPRARACNPIAVWTQSIHLHGHERLCEPAIACSSRHGDV
jgi:hypothetical protein